MISIVMPTYNEENVLPQNLRVLFTQPGDYEVVIVDGGSTDRTRVIVDQFNFQHPSPLTPHPSRQVVAAPKGRASQMNVGAQAARGEWLLFLHADTVLPHGSLRRLNELEEHGEVQAGGFMHQFSGDDWRLRLISLLDNFRCARSRIIYGDQALFIRRSLFEQLGGFPNQPILEDVAFCERVINVTSPVLLSPPVVTDARKFVKMGVWRSFIRVLLIILHVEFRLPVLPRRFFQDVR
ncbi:MAG TPA: TIGR04283 family arsenosugar biosynthesis glycosyltransferase [Nitrospira sp.]|nr:TIGR04283 family arsenosugar biosynthesis glycosyltransferase [Nitrospira sp.]